MKHTLTDFLRHAAVPVGNTLYIWGGGWNEADTGAGPDACRLDASARWQKFYRLHATADYDFNQFRYAIKDGLDCSGFIGWAIYGALEETDGKPGYVVSSTDMASSLEKRGLGVCLPDNREVFALPGDIVSMRGHVYLSLGICADGSQLLLHSSPPAPAFCGTELSGYSMASRTAESIMATLYPAHTAIFPHRACNHRQYTEGTTVFRFHSTCLPDTDRLRSRSPAELISFLFPTFPLQNHI